MVISTSSYQFSVFGHTSVSVAPLPSSDFSSRNLPSSTSFKPSSIAQNDNYPDRRTEFETELLSVLECAYRVAYHLTNCTASAEDLVQDAALIGFNRFSTFKPGTNFRAWYLKILKNCFLMNVRKHKKVRFCVELSTTIPEHEAVQVASSDTNPESTDPAVNYTQLTETQQIAAEMQQLPPEYRLVCVFSMALELSYREIAEQLQIPVGTVRSRLHRGRKLLQERLLKSGLG